MLSWSNDCIRVHCDHESTAFTSKRTFTSVTVWSILLKNLLLSIQISSDWLSHEWSELKLSSSTLIFIISRSSAISSFLFVSATYNHACCLDIYRYKSFSTQCHMHRFSSQVKEGTVEKKMHTVRSVTTEWATTAVVWKVNDITVLKCKISKNSRVQSIIVDTADAITK